MKATLLYRGWRYFRDGFSLYITYPLSIFNFLTLTYYLMAERIPILQQVFPDFSLFVITAFLIVAPLGVILGYVHLRRSRVYSTEVQVATECNAMLCHINRTNMEQSIAFFKKFGVPLSKDYLKMFEYWKRQDERGKWKP